MIFNGRKRLFVLILKGKAFFLLLLLYCIKHTLDLFGTKISMIHHPIYFSSNTKKNTFCFLLNGVKAGNREIQRNIEI